MHKLGDWIKRVITVVIALLSSYCLPLYSQPVSTSLSYTLGDILSLTLLNNPELSTFSYDRRAGEAKILQASFRPNPEFDLESENINIPEFRQTTFLLSQLFETGGKRQARLHFAKTERDRVILDYEVKKRQLFIDTILLFIEVLINQQKIAFLEENLKILEEFSSSVKKRVNVGKASIIEESNYIVLLNTARIDLRNTQNELRNSKSKLAAQWGEVGHDTFIALGSLDWIPELIPFEKMGDLLQEHPLIVRSYFEDNLRTAKITLEKSKAYPDVNLRGGPRYLEEARQWAWVVGVTVPLPIHDRNQGRIWESQENLTRLEKEREAIWIKLITDLNTSYSTIETVTSELDLLKTAILPAAQKAYDFSYKGYQLARYNYLELLETERAYRTSKIRYLQALGEHHKALTILQGLTGSKAMIMEECE